MPRRPDDAALPEYRAVAGEHGRPASGKVSAARDAVLSRLGAPDEAWGESRLVYRWRKVVGEVGWIGGQSSPMISTYALEIEFDGRGAVTVTRLK